MISEEIFLNKLLLSINENENNILNLVYIIEDRRLLKKLIELLTDYLLIENEIIKYLNKNNDFKKISIGKIKKEYNMLKKTMDFL